MTMYHTRAGSYDEIPEGMEIYINNYGCHFNKKLSDEAARRMYSTTTGRKERIKPYTKEQVDNLLKAYGIEVQRGKLYDCVYAANLCVADFLGKSVPDERHLALYIKDVIDDIDAVEGLLFNRFYSDSIFTNNPIEWEDVI